MTFDDRGYKHYMYWNIIDGFTSWFEGGGITTGYIVYKVDISALFYYYQRILCPCVFDHFGTTLVTHCFKGSGHYWLFLKIIIIIKPFLIISNGERLII